MPILERAKTTARFIRKCVRIAIFSLGITVIVVTAGLTIYQANVPAPSPRALAVQHEFRAQASELEHRTLVCNNTIDSMIPGTDYVNAAATHCALMWTQMRRLEAFIAQEHISSSTIQPLIEGSFRAAARYAEYQKAINRPEYKSSDSDE